MSWLKKVRFRGRILIAIPIPQQLELDFYPDGGNVVLTPDQWLLYDGTGHLLVVSDEQLHYKPIIDHWTVAVNEFEIIEEEADV